MKIAFRTDASLQIGSGHVMRCLTLADALRVQGAQCHFISRAHPGHLMDIIRQRGYKVNSLISSVQKARSAIKNRAAAGQYSQSQQHHEPGHTAWLGSSWQADAQDTIAVLTNLRPDWLVVDHYALGRCWEDALAAHCRRLLVIDDLADRPHRCHLLLDQNLGRQPQDYAHLVPMHCQVLTGPHNALLRPEFAALRHDSLLRRQVQSNVCQLLITMGGVDQNNATGQVLKVLKASILPPACRITVIMGLTAPWLQNVQELAAQMPWPTEVLVNVNDMAQRMADSDLAIGAAGSTSWERCCLGLPTLMVVLADNQRGIAASLEHAGAAIALGFNDGDQFAETLKKAVAHLVNNGTALTALSQAAAKVTNGSGTNLVVSQMLDKYTL